MGASHCPHGLCQPEALVPVFERLASDQPIRIVPYGDSHTAGGRIPDALISRLRIRFGSRIDLVALGEVGAALTDFEPLSLEPAPDLVILAYGTNDGFEADLDAGAWEALLRDRIARLRHHVPDAALLILGAPDALRSGVVEGCSADRLRAPPPGLAVVRDVQGRVAADLGVAFWDWHGRMGGDCSADRLALRGEPFMRGDRVHFTNAGADWIGGVLWTDLLTAYDAWTAARAGAE